MSCPLRARLRREGARASVRKLDRLLAMVEPTTVCAEACAFMPRTPVAGAAAAITAKFETAGDQRPDAAVDAVLSGDIARVASWAPH